MNKLIVIDCHYILHRSKFAMRNLSHDEKRTGCIFGFLLSLCTIANKFKLDRFCFAWDSSKSFRKRIYPGYKHRDAEQKEEIVRLNKIALPQFPIVRDRVLPTIGFKNSFIQTGYEADDIICQIVTKYSNSYDIIIISRDNDLLQLLDHCCLWSLDDKKLLDRKWLKKTHGIEPKQWIDVKCLAGCESDMVEGIQGVAEKTALKYIRGELPKHFKAFSKIESDEGRKIAERNRQLVGLPFEGTMDVTLEDEQLSTEGFLSICSEFGFSSFTRELDRWIELFRME